ncbi:MAG: hypothetical protein HYZ13_04575 [Acidobacteria bacterium]|nr:hypothetical protein [Acidobacteriota bacterium]
MNRSTILAILLLPFLGAPLASQEAAPAAQAPDASNIPLAQRLNTVRPEVDRLLDALQPKEALAKAEALLPAAKPTWDNTDGNAQYRSYTTFPDYASAYYLASRAATAAGEWEKGLDYLRKAQAVLQDNAAQAQIAFPKISEAYLAQAQRGRDMLKDNEAFIKELRAKANPDAGDLQQLGLVAAEEKGIANNEKWAKIFLSYIDVAKKDATRYDDSVKAQEDRIKAEETNIASYKAGKGDKAKWVDAIVSNPSYLTTGFPDKRTRFEFLCRLALLDPTNAKVTTAIDVELGKVPPPPVKATKPAKPIKGKKNK